MNAWVLLLLAGVAEIGWVLGLKYSDGLTKTVPTIFTVAALSVSMILLGMAVKTLPIGTSYAVWTGIGAVGAAIAGLILFGESANALRLACIGLIVAGVVGLKLTSPH